MMEFTLQVLYSAFFIICSSLMLIHAALAIVNAMVKTITENESRNWHTYCAKKLHLYFNAYELSGISLGLFFLAFFSGIFEIVCTGIIYFSTETTFLLSIQTLPLLAAKYASYWGIVPVLYFSFIYSLRALYKYKKNKAKKLHNICKYRI